MVRAVEAPLDSSAKMKSARPGITASAPCSLSRDGYFRIPRRPPYCSVLTHKPFNRTSSVPADAPGAPVEYESRIQKPTARERVEKQKLEPVRAVKILMPVGLFSVLEHILSKAYRRRSGVMTLSTRKARLCVPLREAESDPC